VPKEAGGSPTSSVERALTLLATFGDQRVELSVTDISKRLGVHKSTASRLAATLERSGFLVRSGERYRLGAEVMRLGDVALKSFDVVSAAQPAMKRLAELTGETVNLGIVDGEHVLNVAEVPSAFIVSSATGWTGRRTKPHAVANGKVLLAFAGMPLPTTLDRYTDHTITSRNALERELSTVRRRGFAVAVAELEDGLVAVAAPFLDGSGRCIAALSVSGPANRLTPDRLNEVGRLCVEEGKSFTRMPALHRP
jgi:DNA-binding IclR family transcriptional regulator